MSPPPFLHQCILKLFCFISAQKIELYYSPCRLHDLLKTWKNNISSQHALCIYSFVLCPHLCCSGNLASLCRIRPLGKRTFCSRCRPCWFYTSSCRYRPRVFLLDFEHLVSTHFVACRLVVRRPGMAESSFPGKLRCVKWVIVLVSIVICIDLSSLWMIVNLD